MGLETGTYVNELNVANPTASDKRRFGDDHLRLIKATLKNTFANITSAVTVTHTELNHLAGVTSAIQTQLNAKLEASDVGLSGTDGVSVSGSLNALVASVDSTVLRTTGAQSVAGVKTFTDRPIFGGQGGMLSHDNSSNSGGRVIIQDNEPVDLTGLNPGDIVLVF